MGGVGGCFFRGGNLFFGVVFLEGEGSLISPKNKLFQKIQKVSWPSSVLPPTPK